MPFNHFHQTIEDILKTATPEQKIVWNELFLFFGENISIRQVDYTGGLIGSEFNTYNANKYYFAYQLTLIPSNAGISNAAYALATLYAWNNASMLTIGVNNIAWNATAAAMYYSQQPAVLANVGFSRIANATYDTIRFIGYRIGR